MKKDSCTKYLNPFKKRLIVGPIFKLIEAIFELIVPILMARIIDIGIKNSDNQHIKIKEYKKLTKKLNQELNVRNDRIDKAMADFEEKIQVVHKKDLKNRADYARITTLYTGLVLRARQPGDRFRPAGRGLSKPLRKWMNEAGVPNELRDTLPLLASGSEILWVCGEGFADGLAPDTESRWILHLDAEIETQEEKTNEYAR